MNEQWVRVIASRDEPRSEISAIVRDDEWDRLFALAEQLPNDCVWQAQRVDTQSHKSASASVSPEGQQ